MLAKKEPHYFTHLSNDQRLAPLLLSSPHKRLVRKKNVYLQLMSSIMSQQLSTKVAKVIYNRFIDLFNGDTPVPQQVHDIPFDELRSIGLSNAKTQYIKNIALHALEHDMSDKRLYRMSNEEVMEFLLPIKGVGKWTVEMLLMFALAREDVFAPDDLGIQQAMQQLYMPRTKDKKKMREKMLKQARRWSPYRTYACLYLWEYKDGA